ncbi:MAG: YtxH domain-containing protein [Chloroflexi bacterium]|nr:YtxH domain-containing protein [Chloroflexota bacterium]
MDKSRDPDVSPSFLKGAFLGLLAGSVAAIWWSPRSGAETRQQIRRRIETIVERFRGESPEEAIEEGKAIAHARKSEHAQPAARSD